MTAEKAIRDAQEQFSNFAADREREKMRSLLDQSLGASGLVECYWTDTPNPSQQLKNKLGQAHKIKGGLLMLAFSSKEIHDRARTILVDGWANNDDWQKVVACVAIAYPVGKRWRIGSIVEWTRSKFPDQVKARLFPAVEVIAAKGSPAETSGPVGSTDELAEQLFLPVAWVEDVLWMLRDKRGVILYGPPGTGKTFIAQRLASHLQPDKARRILVQLHPSYGYEEFFEGYRPTETGNGLNLAKRPGPLRRLATISQDKNPAVLLVDEINRGNLPRIFGELYFLLEYRDESAALLYSPEEQFTLPESLYIIGTMNTADRSIALLDQALRRRFHFVGLFPGEPTVDGMLRGFLRKHKPEMIWLADILDRANGLIDDQNIAIGPSHFMRKDIDETIARKVWKYSVLPSIAEHHFGDAKAIEQFDFDVLRAESEAARAGTAEADTSRTGDDA